MNASYEKAEGKSRNAESRKWLKLKGVFET
jgi:hypothetical protein